MRISELSGPDPRCVFDLAKDDDDRRVVVYKQLKLVFKVGFRHFEVEVVLERVDVYFAADEANFRQALN